jgi:hypothetical protein
MFLLIEMLDTILHGIILFSIYICLQLSKKEYYRLKKKAKQKKHRKIKTEKKKKKNPLVVVNQYNNPLPGAYSFTRIIRNK